MLARMFRWVITTPFGSAVAPEVKMISTTVSRVGVNGASDAGIAAREPGRADAGNEAGEEPIPAKPPHGIVESTIPGGKSTACRGADGQRRSELPWPGNGEARYDRTTGRLAGTVPEANHSGRFRPMTTCPGSTGSASEGRNGQLSETYRDVKERTRKPSSCTETCHWARWSAKKREVARAAINARVSRQSRRKRLHGIAYPR